MSSISLFVVFIDFCVELWESNIILAIMDTPQIVWHLNLALGFLHAHYMDKKSELLLPIRSALISHGGVNKSRNPIRFCCTEADSVSMSAKHEARAPKGTLFSRNRRSELSDATIAPGKGLGIVEFLRRKNILVTRATGFLGKGVRQLLEVINYFKFRRKKK